MVDQRSNIFDNKIRRQQGSQKLLARYILNDHVKNPNKNNNQRISTHLEEQILLPAEQKGFNPGSKDCKGQVMISKAVYADCSRRNNNLSIAWTDYQKAFDCVPHGRLEVSIAFVGVNSKILDFVNYLWRNGTQGIF